MKRRRVRPYLVGLAVEVIDKVLVDGASCPECASGVVDVTYCTTRGRQVLAVRTVRCCDDMPLCTWTADAEVST